MGAVILLAPVVVAAWPAFATAVVSAAASLGYSTAENALNQKSEAAQKRRAGIEIEVPNSELVTGQLGRDEKMAVTRGDVTITFKRDARGKASLSVSGDGQSHEELRAIGEEMSQRVVRDYVYQQIMNEVCARDFVVVEESVDGSNAIHLTVRHWET